LRVAYCGQRFALPDNPARAYSNKKMKWNMEMKKKKDSSLSRGRE
jgi:hypothetical protein